MLANIDIAQERWQNITVNKYQSIKYQKGEIKMMEYEVFKKVVTERIKEFLPSIYAKFDVTIEPVPKINGMKEAMIVCFETEDCRMSGPNIYLDDLYREFTESNDLDFIMHDTACKIVAFTGTQMLCENDAIEMERYKPDIVKMLINTEMNTGLLAMAPHKEFMDLSVIYRMAVSDADGHGYATALITNDLLKELKMAVDELDALAEENSRRKFKTKVVSVAPECRMMATEGLIYGAINLERMDEIKKIADEMDSDLYLLPSSIHDIMAFSAKICNSTKVLFEMLKEGNETCNDEDEFLSNNIYYYSRSENTVELITREQ